MNNKKAIVHALIGANRMHHRCIEGAVRGMKIHHSQHRLLVHLSRCDLLPSQKELAARFEISPAAVAGLLKKLEKDGYITRTPDEGDTRLNRIAITEKGQAILDETQTQFDSVDNTMLSGFTDEELTALGGYLDRMKQNLTVLCGEEKNSDRKEVSL